MHWLGQYIIKHITNGGIVKIENLNGELIQRRVTDSILKLYIDGLA